MTCVPLKQSTSVVVSFGPFVDKTDGITFETALAGTGANQLEHTSSGILIAKNGGTLAARHATATASTYDAYGMYKVTLDTTDTATLGILRVCFGNNDAVPVWQDFTVLAANIYDSLYGGGDILDVSVTQWLGTAVSTPTVAGVPNVNAKTWNDLATVALPLVPTTAGRTLDVSTGGEAGLDWANVGSPTTTLALTGTTIATTQKVDIETIKTNPVVNGGTITFPTTATLASTTNITAGTITTATTATNVTTVSSGAISEASYATTAGTFAPLMIVDRGTAQSATGTTLVLRAAAAFADTELVGATIVIRTATTGAGQSRKITAYVGSTDTATVDTWTTTPTGTITYDIFGTAKESASLNQVDVTKWNGTAVSSPATAGIPDVNVKNIDNDAASASGTVTFPNATLASTTNITSATGVDITKILGTAISTPATAGILDVNVKNIDNDAASASGTVTFPNATLASTTNITAGTLTTVTTATNVTTVNGLAAGVVTAAAIADGAIDRATFAADTGLQSLRSNTAQAGAATTITLDASASASNNFYNNTLIVLTGGTGVGQARFITAYVGATKVATVATWTTNPDNTTTFAIMPFDAVAGASAPTTAQIATAVWTDLLAGSDFSTASSIGKLLKDDIDAAISSRSSQTSVDTIDDFVDTEVAAIKTKTDFLPSATAGAAGGLAIAGSNAATTFATLTVTGATTLTGNVVLSDGLTVSIPSTANRTGVTISGNGSAAGLRIIGGSASGSGMTASGGGIGAGLVLTGGATGIGFNVVGGATSGDGIKVTTTSGHGLNLAPVGTDMHGILSTGGNGGTSDGVKAVAGTGGVPIRGDITGNITGTVSGAVGDVLKINGSSVAAVNLARSARAIVTVTVGSASTTTSVVTSALSPAGADTATDQLKGRILIFDDTTTTAALRGQATDITGSSTGGVLTVTALTTAPASGDTATIT